MPIPIAPIAGVALRYGAVAIATYAIVRASGTAPRVESTETALDQVDEGVQLRRDREQLNMTGRIRRVIRFGTAGPGFDVDATALARIRVRRA